MQEWLSWIASVHISDIALGLDRIRAVGQQLGVLSPSCPTIIVGGTNGKGSTVAGLEAIYLAAGYHVGAFTTPYLFQYNEQVRIDGQSVSDDLFCQAFAKIEDARGDIPLTMFEFGTLAALIIFQEAALDVWILEVGLGGRLDGVNIIDADVAMVTSIGIDHVEWLGDTREAIAFEKAGIFRKGMFAVCGDVDVPKTLSDHAEQIGAIFYTQGRDFNYQEDEKAWSWSFEDVYYSNLPPCLLALQNMSTVLMGITLLQKRLPVERAAIDQGLSSVRLPGRIQVIEGPVTTIFDVSHNPAAVAFLAKRLDRMAHQGKTYAVFSMLADKDISESIKGMKNKIDAWYVAPLGVKRGASEERLRAAFEAVKIDQVMMCASIKEAYEAAMMKAQVGDRVIIFGSFYTIAGVTALPSL